MGPGQTPYTPSSRRPIAAAFRRTADRAVRFCVARGVHPDVISYLAVVAAAAAAAQIVRPAQGSRVNSKRDAGAPAAA
jgi:hypothetical protein